jgi:hypothetical protein
LRDSETAAASAALPLRAPLFRFSRSSARSLRRRLRPLRLEPLPSKRVMLDDSMWGMILGKSGKIPGTIDPELVELAQKQGREFTDVDAHTLLTDALDDFRKEMAENGWECGQDDEELFELAMHPEQYRNYKSGQAKKNFLADLQKLKDAKLGANLSPEQLSAYKHAKADAVVAPVKGDIFWEFSGEGECAPTVEPFIGTGSNPGILISGHDLKDIEDLLIQTEGTGIDVYTHGEMLPAHYYPQLKKYKHLVGNYGNAWWKQKEEFESFNGPVVFTTNCIVPPSPSAGYRNRVFTTNSTGFPGWKHIQAGADGHKDFSEVIALAKTCQPPKEIETGEIIGGFAHAQVFALADKIVEAVKSGAIRKFVVMSGCDGRMKSRNYYEEFAKALPQDVVILTSGCAKFKYNKLNLGDINGIPRVLDAGQCNDSYSWAVVALKLKEIFGASDINELPIFFNIAWYEQKAVIVLLALLHLGVKNIHLGPTLPAFCSPAVLKVLVDTFGKSKWLSFGGWINAIIPILIVYIFAQKYFKEGLTVGGVKG